jgi:hypothetical protein
MGGLHRKILQAMTNGGREDDVVPIAMNCPPLTWWLQSYIQMEKK